MTLETTLLPKLLVPYPELWSPATVVDKGGTVVDEEEEQESCGAGGLGGATGGTAVVCVIAPVGSNAACVWPVGDTAS